MKKKLIISLLILPSVIAIGILDYSVFGGGDWHRFILPSFIETALFIIGIRIGYVLKENELIGVKKD